MEENNNVLPKFYSQRAITIATYLGGPLAAGYLAGQNFKSIGKKWYAKYAIVIGAVSTLLLFAGIFSIPEYIINKIPNLLIPLVYTGIIYLLIEKLQGKDLKQHKDTGGEFYSAWKATGIGVICLVIISCGVLGYVYLIPDKFDSTKYDNEMAIFNKNEGKALELFNFFETSSPQTSLEFIDKDGIPAWKANIKILSDLDKLEGIYNPLLKQDHILRVYCNLRLEQFQLIRNSLIRNTIVDEIEMQKIVKKIDEEIAKLNK